MLRMHRLRLKYNRVGLLSWFLALVVSAAAFGGAILLGGMYIDIVREGAAANSKTVAVEETETVNVGEPEKSLILNPVPVYYLQAGVYSTLAGAEAAAKPLIDAGYLPYITQSAPHRIWIGLFQKRSDAEPVKTILADLGVSSFTGSTVLNGASLTYGQGNEVFIQSLVPILEVCTDWMKENLGIFNSDSVENLDWNTVQGQAAAGQEIHQSLLALQAQPDTNNEEVNRLLADLFASAESYRGQLETFLKAKGQVEYANLQHKYLSFVDNYLLLGHEIDNISKT